MKRRLFIVLACFLAMVTLASVSYATESTGGWTGTESISIPEDVQAAFYQVTSSITDVNYESVGLLSSQVVSGTNYCLLCRTRIPGSDQAPGYSLMYIYVDTNGAASLLRVEKLEFSIDKDSAGIVEEAAEAQADNSSTEAKTSDSSEATMGEKNAADKAKSYLAFTAFSYSGLIDQLEFEGFSTEEATYGADHCGADWNEQAAKKAESYLDFMSFSRSGLIDQLVFEGFTQEQAEYGANAVGY